MTFFKEIQKYINENYPNKYNFHTKNQKFSLRTIIDEVIYFLKSGISYSYYRGDISPKTLNKHILFFSRNNIFEKVYKTLYSKYIKIKNASKLKYLSIDTSFIMNKCGRTKLGRNKFYKNKNCYKLSIIIDAFKNPISASVEAGNLNDAKIGINNISNLIYDISKLKKAYILADKIYDTNEFRHKCKNNNLIPIIDYNKRNTKDVQKINKLNKEEKTIYRKRIKVENTFAILKKYKRIDKIYDFTPNTYLSFVYLSLCLRITN